MGQIFGGGGGGGSSGITGINSDLTAAQTLSVGTTGSDFAITDAGSGSHVFNIPDAGASARGLVTTGAQTLAGQKTFSSAPILSSLTLSTVPYLDASKVLTSSSVTPTELGYVSGVTSAIQTQIAAKAPTASPTFTGTVSGATASWATTPATGGATGFSITQAPANSASGTYIANSVALTVGTASAGPFFGRQTSVTSPGSSPNGMYGNYSVITGTFGGTAGVYANFADNQVACTSSDWYNNKSGFAGFFTSRGSTTSGSNTGVMANAYGGKYNLAVYGIADSAAGSSNLLCGVLGKAVAGPTSYVGGHFTIGSTDNQAFWNALPAIKAALACDNTDTSDSVFQGLVNGVKKVEIASDGKLLATIGLGVGNSATATVGVGVLAKKIEVFDASGSSLGFVPVYATIT